eukprot:15447057-Alexandrium_andersonii.AAC.1
MALGRPLPGGGRRAPLPWRASGSPVEKPARVASTTLSLTSGASRMGATVASRSTTRAWARSRTT